MNNYISRRSFIQSLGMMSALCMSSDILNSLEYLEPALSDNSTSNKARTPTCFIGVGKFGRELKTELLKNNPSDRKPSYPGDLDRIVFLDLNDIDFDSLSLNNHLIFLAGSFFDENYWAARDLIKSKNPKLLVLTVFPDYGATVYKSILSKNECWITLPMNEASRAACNIINDIYTWQNEHLDLEKFNHYVTNLVKFNFTTEGSTEKNISELRHLFNQHRKDLKKCKKLHFLVFDDHKTDYEGLMNFFKRAQKKVGKKTQIHWKVFSYWDLNPKFRATILAS